MLLSFLLLSCVTGIARNRFEGKVCLITGGTSGIGKEVSVALANEGCKVIFTGRREAKGAEVQKEIESQGGIATFVRADVTVEEDNKRMVDIAVEMYGRLDVAFNNAGIVNPNMMLHEYDTEKWKNLMDINLNGVFYGLKYELAQMMNQEGGGSILNCNSIYGMTYLGAWHTAYTVSKHALTGLTKVAALQYAEHGIRVNDINPGYTDSSGMAVEFAGGIFKDLLGELHPMGRMVKMEGVVNTALFALSDDAIDVSGVQLEVSGGVSRGFMPGPVRKKYIDKWVEEIVAAEDSEKEAPKEKVDL